MVEVVDWCALTTHFDGSQLARFVSASAWRRLSKPLPSVARVYNTPLAPATHPATAATRGWKKSRRNMGGGGHRKRMPSTAT
jgi:hypothetical protein